MTEVVNIEDEILADNLKHSQEERRANGRMVALIIAISVILYAIYHSWVRKTRILSGALVPFLIMIVYGGWVVFLAKRDKKRRLLMAQRMGEKMSEKGSEYGTQENLISPPPGKGLAVANPTVAKSSTTNTINTPRKKRRLKNPGVNKSCAKPTSNGDVAIHKPNGKTKQKRHTPAEVISKLRQDRVPLCRTCSAP